MAEGGASAAVEATLAREQAELERTLATWRVRVFVAFTVISVVVGIVGFATAPPQFAKFNVIPIFYFGAGAFYFVA